MPRVYTLHITCPHCGLRHTLPDWPGDGQGDVLYVCTRDHGGCGRHALVHPPALDLFQHVGEVSITPEPLTKAQVTRLIRTRGMPHGIR